MDALIVSFAIFLAIAGGLKYLYESHKEKTVLIPKLIEEINSAIEETEIVEQKLTSLKSTHPDVISFRTTQIPPPKAKSAANYSSFIKTKKKKWR